MRMKSFGILSDDLKERAWTTEELRRSETETPTRTLTWWLYIPMVYLRFAEIIERVADSFDGHT